MRLPKTVRIGSQEINVVFKDKIIHRGNECIGLWCHDEQEIRIERGLHQDKKKEVFLHECLHAIDDLYDIGLGEKKVNILGVSVLALIKNNNLDFLL